MTANKGGKEEITQARKKRKMHVKGEALVRVLVSQQ